MFSIRGEWMRKWLQYVSIPSPVILSVSVCNIVRDAAWVPAYGSIDCIARNGQLPLQERYRSVFVSYADTVEHPLKVHAWSVHFTSGCSSMTSCISFIKAPFPWRSPLISDKSSTLFPSHPVKHIPTHSSFSICTWGTCSSYAPPRIWYSHSFHKTHRARHCRIPE